MLTQIADKLTSLAMDRDDKATAHLLLFLVRNEVAVKGKLSSRSMSELTRLVKFWCHKYERKDTQQV